MAKATKQESLDGMPAALIAVGIRAGGFTVYLDHVPELGEEVSFTLRGEVTRAVESVKNDVDDPVSHSVSFKTESVTINKPKPKS